MNTLVSGGTGMVGNNVVRLLLAQGHSVRVLARRHSDPRPFEGLEVERVEGDVCDPAAVRAACEGVEQVVHAAAVVHVGWTGMDLQRAVNVEGTRNTAQAALETGAKLVHVSSVDTVGLRPEGTPADEETPFAGKVNCPYVVTKGEAERLVVEMVQKGLQAVIVNPGFMLGPWDWKPSSGRMLLKVAKNFTPVAPPGGISACDVRDVAAGILAALHHGQPGRRYILAGHNLSFVELWRQIKAVTGGRPPAAKMRRFGLRLAGAIGDAAAKLTGTESDVNSAAVRMSGLIHFYSSQRAEQELEYNKRPIAETISDAWTWFKQHGYV